MVTSRCAGSVAATSSAYRIVDFVATDNAAAKVAEHRVRSEPLARIALFHYMDGERQATSWRPTAWKVGAGCLPNADIANGNCLSLRGIPVGTNVHNVEFTAATRASRAAGASPADGEGRRLRAARVFRRVKSGSST